ncbi:trans-aconitate methyltransferase 2 [Suhomyces tanzawaensis NRRL Y-17324]|uniref:Trans-aconitate methyltransferase 2 n=1 Tax=Suhomyces tanzawaensis NRRL Y-17324 TaxID=984487 RepID=A0A1E4SN44_9ASCO|nr:trans-aconitate methyltransferase 2 [Suhomyces tanzawaensis NRRL Y-17324]ODV80941.1 trans-aconitate methyltransferase 2 [Suhomyces tanzawaensis NRRL Y-17324]
MASFSKTNFKALSYNSFRPHYPPSFYNILTSYVTKDTPSKLPIESAIDLGCGTGVATYPLLNFSKRVTGLDLSPVMIETANSLKSERLNQLGISDENSISFKQGAVEDFVNNEPREIEDESVDLITAAQCIHWFEDFDAFFRNAAKLLKKGGTLAYFYYVDPVVVGYTGSSKLDRDTTLKRAKEIYFKYAYDDPELLGPHWEQPGRNIIKDQYSVPNSKVPEDVYEDITINDFEPDFNGISRATEKDLDLKKENISLQGFADYVLTYSSYHNYKEAKGDKGEVLEQFIKELESEFGWDRNETKIDLVWTTGYTFLRKK